MYLINKFKNKLGDSFTEHSIEHSKLLLIYIQMHYLSDLYGEKFRINLQFFDDKKVDILFKLKYFFEKHLEWIPNNIKLSLFHFSKKQTPPKKEGELQGTGTVNLDYANHMKDLWTSFSNYQKTLETEVDVRKFKFIDYCDMVNFPNSSQNDVGLSCPKLSRSS